MIMTPETSSQRHSWAVEQKYFYGQLSDETTILVWLFDLRMMNLPFNFQVTEFATCVPKVVLLR